MSFPREDTHGTSFLNRLTAFFNVELPVDVAQVCIDGCGRNEDFLCDLLRAQPLSQQFQDIEFAIGQRLNKRLGDGGTGGTPFAWQATPNRLGDRVMGGRTFMVGGSWYHFVLIIFKDGQNFLDIAN